jgi:hypothetical protein
VNIVKEIKNLTTPFKINKKGISGRYKTITGIYRALRNDINVIIFITNLYIKIIVNK